MQPESQPATQAPPSEQNQSAQQSAQASQRDYGQAENWLRRLFGNVQPISQASIFSLPGVYAYQMHQIPMSIPISIATAAPAPAPAPANPPRSEYNVSTSPAQVSFTAKHSMSYHLDM